MQPGKIPKPLPATAESSIELLTRVPGTCVDSPRKFGSSMSGAKISLPILMPTLYHSLSDTRVFAMFASPTCKDVTRFGSR